ncbi:MAG: hypothetical protein KIT44_09710 [Opitutaceae bacterium]|nr:hypothetical protein [Opitutaceae bacterium]
MKPVARLLLPVVISFAILPAGLIAEPEAPPTQEERVRARLAERAKEKAEKARAEAPATKEREAGKTDAEPPKAAEPADEDVTALPEMEIRQTRIHDLDLKIRQLNRDIRREQRKVKPTDADAALNNRKSSRIMSIFGGKSAEQRASVAAERVYLMEQERDLLELMKLPMTAAKLRELEGQVDALRTVRRNLDIELR